MSKMHLFSVGVTNVDGLHLVSTGRSVFLSRLANEKPSFSDTNSSFSKIPMLGTSVALQ